MLPLSSKPPNGSPQQGENQSLEQSWPSRPTTHPLSQASQLSFIHHTKFAPTSGLWYLWFPLSGIVLAQMSIWLTSSFPSGLCLYHLLSEAFLL